jgi:hypothetical protein
MIYSYQTPAFDIFAFCIFPRFQIVVWQMKDASALSEIDRELNQDVIRVESKPFAFYGWFFPIKSWQPRRWHWWLDSTRYGWKLRIQLPSCDLAFYWDYTKPQ